MSSRVLPALLLLALLAPGCGGSATDQLDQTASGNAGTSAGGSSGAGGGEAQGGAGGSEAQGGAAGTSTQAGAAGASAQGGAAGQAAGGSSGAAGASLDSAACVPGDCLLEDADCCGFCGLATPSNYDAVLYDQVDAHQSTICTGSGPCPPHCAPLKNADLAAFCQPPPHCDSSGCDMMEAECAVIEIHKADISSCDKDIDCEIRKADCCDCGPTTPDDLIAINTMLNGYYEKQVCGHGVGLCTQKCAPQHPSGFAATCNPTSHHCEVTATK